MYSGLGACDLISTGSLLSFAEELVRDLRPVVWGSGFISPGAEWAGSDLDVRAVRGKLTLARLPRFASPEIALGDPGLLTSLAYPEFREAKKQYRVGIIPHFVDFDHPRVERFKSMPGVQVIDVVAPVEQVIEQLTACRLVVSSSLHGLVVAESYGIPNAWITLSDEIIGGRYKFDDYYSAAGESRNPVELEQVVAEADDYIDSWRPIQGLSTLQAQLLRAFPIRPVAEVMDRLSHPARSHR